MKVLYVCLGCLALAVLASGAWLCKRYWQRPEFDSLIIGAWSAAFGTLVFGFLVALSVLLIQNEEQNSTAVQAEKTQANAARQRLSTLLTSELSIDLDTIKLRRKTTNPDWSLLIVNAPLKFAFWQSVSSSGDLRGLRDLDVVSILSDAYASIQNADYWERRYLEVISGPGLAINTTDSAGNQRSMPAAVNQIALLTYAPAEQAVAKAIEALSRKPTD